MFFEIRENRLTAPAPKKDTALEKSVNSVTASLTCLFTLGLAILISQKLNPTDAGKTFEVAQIPALMKQEVLRIQNDPLMPPQAKRMALGALAAHRVSVPPQSLRAPQ